VRPDLGFSHVLRWTQCASRSEPPLATTDADQPTETEISKAYWSSQTALTWPETSVPNADACWLIRIITADSACIAILKILSVKFLSGLIYEELALFRPNL
jgi:hypothetical protein